MRKQYPFYIGFVTSSFIVGSIFRIQRFSCKKSFLIIFKVQIKVELNLNKSTQSLIINKTKSALLTLLNQNPFKSFKSNNTLHISVNYNLLQKWKKIKVLKYSNIFKISLQIIRQWPNGKALVL